MGRGRKAKFTQEQKDEIIAMLASGKSKMELATEYGVSMTTIYNIAKPKIQHE